MIIKLTSGVGCRFLFRNQINLTFAQYVKQIVRPDTRKGQVAKITATGPLTDVANWWSYLQNGEPGLQLL